MFKAGHARLLAAMIAAIGLHALFFSLLPSQNSLLLHIPEGDLHVELLAQKQDSRPAKVQHASSTPHAVKEHVKPEPLSQKQHISHRHQQPPAPQPGTIADQQSHKTNKQVNKQTIKSNETKAVAASDTSHVAIVKQSSEESAAASSGAVIPRHIQKTILAQVHYPKRARRHGWQGRAEFQFNVQQKTIHKITMLASTGHPLLDRAARRGLTSVNQIPLSNGLYRMPVVFRLQ